MLYDALVVGLGGMGSAVLAHCAGRGMRVAGLERFAPAHARGASHGRTRIIRQAYFEGAAYVPLLRRAYVLWDDLERRTGRTLRARTGGLFVGTPDRAVVAGTLESARAHDLAHEVLDTAELRRRYPQFRPRAGEIGVFEAVAGALFPERCVLAHLEAAIADGAEAHFGIAVERWDVPAADRVVVRAGGEVLETRRLIVCAGAWLRPLVADFDVPLSIERNVQFWFAPLAPDEVRSGRLPIFALERADWPFMFYGFPDFGDGVKCAFHHSGQFCDPDALVRDVADAEIAAARAALREWLPSAAGELLDAAPCTYALTPDEHFVVGTHPHVPEIVLAGGFSGHGFKFCSVVGEIVADLVADGSAELDIGMFAPARFAGSVVS
jgi:sarcosine oxidase